MCVCGGRGGVALSICIEENYGLLQIWALLVAAMLVCALPKKSWKRLARDVLDTFATRASYVHDVTNTDIKRQHSRLCFRDF